MGSNPLSNFRVVLVGTLYGGNVGSVCRAMANCGMKELRLACPSPDITWKFAETMAVHATDILENRKTYPDLASAVEDCVAVVGTSRRGGLYRSRCQDSRDVAPDLLKLAEGGPVALVFGREDKGLTNEEIMLCTHIVNIASHPDYPSFNLAQSVVLMCHEIYRSSIRFIPSKEKSPLAPSAMRQRLMAQWREYLLRVGFMDEEKADHMMEAFERVFSRGALTESDMKILMGVVRQSHWALDHK